MSKTINATFIADASTAQIIAGDMFIIVNDQVANGQAVNAVQARVTDSYGNPIKDQTVEFVLSNNGTIQYELDVTSVEGGVMVTFTNTLAGITNVTATVVSSGSSRNIDTTFIADVTTAHIAASDLMVIVDDAVADNLDKMRSMHGSPMRRATCYRVRRLSSPLATVLLSRQSMVSVMAMV